MNSGNINSHLLISPHLIFKVIKRCHWFPNKAGSTVYLTKKITLDPTLVAGFTLSTRNLFKYWKTINEFLLDTVSMLLGRRKQRCLTFYLKI